MNQTVKVENMKCAGCAGTVKTNLEAIKGVQEAEVDLATYTVALETEREVEIVELKDALSDTPYKVTGFYQS